MEEDIKHFSPTFMFRGTPCIYYKILISYFKNNYRLLDPRSRQ